MDLISKDSLYNKMVEKEEQALNLVNDTPTMIEDKINPAYTKYVAQLNERTAFKHMIFDEEEVKAIVIPPNATIGDVFKAMFPDAITMADLANGTIDFGSPINDFAMCLQLEVWNKPYKGESKCTRVQ